MAIRFRHEAAAGLIGSYAAGEAAGRLRRQKYALDMLQRQQLMRQRLGGAGGRALAPPEGQFPPDPLADDPALDPAARRGRAAARRARDRKGRLGIDIPWDWQRGPFIPQADIDWQRKVQDEQRRFDRGVAREDDLFMRDRAIEQEDAARTFQQGVEKEGRTATRATFNDPAFSKTQKDEANKLLTEFTLLQGSKRLSAHDEAEAQMQAQDIERRLQEIRDKPEGQPELTLDEQLKKRFVTDPVTGQRFQWMGEEKGLVEVPPPDDPNAAARKLRAKHRTAAKALNAALQAQATEIAKRGGKPLSPDEAKYLQKDVDLAQEALDDVEAEIADGTFTNEEFEKKTVVRDGKIYQELGPDKGIVEVPSGADEAATAAKTKEDWFVKKVNEIRSAEGGEGKTLDQAYAEAEKIFADEEKVRQKVTDAQKKRAADEEMIRQRVRGAAAPAPVTQPAAAAAVPPAPAPAAQPGPIVAEPAAFSREVDAFNRQGEAIEELRDKVDRTSESEVNAFNHLVNRHNRKREELGQKQETLVKAERETAAAAFANQHGVQLGKGRSIPAGFPKGSQSIGDNGILLPDGRVIIPKGR